MADRKHTMAMALYLGCTAAAGSLGSSDAVGLAVIVIVIIVVVVVAAGGTAGGGSPGRTPG